MNTWGDGEFQHIESFKEWQGEDIVPVNKSSWTPPSRNQEGHRIASSLGYVPIETHKLPWRWKLAEIPMRLLARWAMKQDDIKLITGEEPADFKPPLNIGTEMHRQIGQYYADMPPDEPQDRE